MLPAPITAAERQTILTELQTDPEIMGYAPYITISDWNNLALLLNWIRDGETPCSANGVIGPNGTISGATNASPIVIATTIAHGRTTGDTVVIDNVGGNTAANNVPVNSYGLPATGAIAPIPSWTITVVDSTHFSLNGSTGNAAYTSGGTWNWCIAALANTNKIFNGSVPVSAVIANILPADAAVATALAGTQANLLPAFLNPSGNIQLTDPFGNELNTVSWLNLLSQTGTVSHKAVKALETRFGSRAEQLLNLTAQSVSGNNSALLLPSDVAYAYTGVNPG